MNRFHYRDINKKPGFIVGWIIILLIFAAHIYIYRDFFIDDAFITFRFVQQWNAGNGLVYNIGERVEGYSNFLWIVILAPFNMAGFDLIMAAKILGIGLGLSTLIVSWRFGKRFKYPFFAPLLLVCSGSFVVWVMGALETLLFTFLLLLASYTFVREEEKESGWISGLIYGLLALTRPEGVMFAGIATLFRSGQLWKAKKRPARRDWLRLAVLLLITISYFLWRFSYYGSFLPNTVYAKSMGFHPRGFIEGIFYVYQTFLVLGGFFFLALPLTFAILDPNRDSSVSFLFANVVIALIFMIISGGDWMPLQRFAVHILPLIFLLVQAGLSYLTDLFPRQPVKWIVTLLIIGQALFLLFISLEQHFIQGEGLTKHRIDSNQASVAYLKKRLESGDTIAVTRAGINAYTLPLDVRIVDMIGLTDSHIAHQKPVFPNGLMGRGDVFGKWDNDYILAQDPELVEILSPERTETGEWTSGFTGTTQLLNDERFQANYEQSLFGFFEKRDSE